LRDIAGILSVSSDRIDFHQLDEYSLEKEWKEAKAYRL
jgi:hypothetical protein